MIARNAEESVTEAGDRQDVAERHREACRALRTG
jgi:hypothetical protein